MTIGGGLYDHDPEPDRYEVMSEVRIKALHREQAFWVSMVIGFWAAFQGMAIIAFWVMVVLILVAAIKVIMGPMMNEIRRTWRS